MEWVLQLVDEFDDVLGMLAHWSLGAAEGLELFLAAFVCAGVCAAAYFVGVAPVSLAAAAVAFSVASARSWSRRFSRYNAS